MSRLVLGGSWLAVIYVWAVPLIVPRGHYFGRYSKVDLGIGILVAAAALWSSVAYLLPPKIGRRFTIASVALGVPAILLFLTLDAFYALFILGAWERNYWLDRGGISRTHNEADSELGFVRKRGISWRGDGRAAEYRTDRHGFRNPPGLEEADIVFIGDSYTEAAEFAEQDSFVGRVSERTGLVSANLGRGAYGPQQELIVLKRHGLNLSPRIVVWQIFDGNDLADAHEFEAWRKDSGIESVSLFHRYFSNSLARRWLKETLRLPPVSGPPATLRYLDGATQRLSVRYKAQSLIQPAGDPSFAATQSAIAEGARICRDRGIDLLVIFVPTMLRVLEPYIEFDYERDRREYGSKGGAPSLEGEMAKFCRRINCAYVNLEPLLRAAAEADNRDLFIPSDEHLGARGHKVVAEAIYAWLAPRLQPSNTNPRPKPAADTGATFETSRIMPSGGRVEGCC